MEKNRNKPMKLNNGPLWGSDYADDWTEAKVTKIRKLLKTPIQATWQPSMNALRSEESTSVAKEGFTKEVSSFHHNNSLANTNTQIPWVYPG